MSDFQLIAQSLTVALKALQMYTALHPRAQEGLAKAHLALEACLLDQPRLQFIATGAKAFVDGQPQDGRSPQIATLVKLVTERGISGVSFERGLSQDDVLAFLQGLAAKPVKLEEVGGFDGFLKASGVRHVKVSQTRYQEVTEGGESGSETKAPAFSPAPAPPAPPSLPAPPSPSAPSAPPASHSPENLVKFIREALLTSLAKGAALGPGFGKTGFAVGGVRSGSTGGDEDGSPGGLAEEGGIGPFSGFGPADLSGLGPLGRELGLGEGMPTPGQLGTLRQVLMGLSPEVQFSLLAGLGSLPEHPAGLGLGVKALAGEILAVSTSTMLAKGISWPQLKGPIQDILRPLPDRERLMRTLASHLRVTGLDASQAEAILRHLAWEELSLEAKILKVLEEGHFYELSHEERLALLRELLDLRRFDDFVRIQEVLLETLRSDRADLRLLSVKTLNGVARWTFDPGLPPEAEGPLAEALRAHFAWEPDPPIHRWTTEALESLFSGLIQRRELGHVLADYQELEGLCAFLDEQQPWRNEALGRLRRAIERPDLLDLAVDHALSLKREDMLPVMQPYFEFTGDAMARHLTFRLGEESDRARRGRLVESVRSMGPAALPALTDSLNSPAWYLIRNALTLLSDLGGADCVPAILPHLRHPEPRVRRTAVRALWKLGGPVAEPHLLARMKDTDAETMQEILFALGQLRSEAGLPQVAELAQDRRVLERIRIQALDTIGHIGSDKAMPALQECIKRKGFFGGGEPQPIRLAAARAMAALGTPEALCALRKAVEAEPKGEEREAMQRLMDRPVPL